MLTLGVLAIGAVVAITTYAALGLPTNAGSLLAWFAVVLVVTFFPLRWYVRFAAAGGRGRSSVKQARSAR